MSSLTDRVKCLLGRHDWHQQSQEGAGGAAAVFALCRRCGKERPEYGNHPHGGVQM